MTNVTLNLSMGAWSPPKGELAVELIGGLADIGKAAGKLRWWYYTNSLPWRETSGDRLIPAAYAAAFYAGFSAAEDEVAAAMAAFFPAAYELGVDRTEFLRDGEQLFPSADEAAAKFYVTLDIESVSSPLRLDMEPDFRVAQAREEKARLALVAKLQRPLEAFIAASKFRDSTVVALVDAVRIVTALAPALAGGSPPAVAGAVELLRPQLTLGPDKLRKDAAARAAAANAATEALKILIAP